MDYLAIQEDALIDISRMQREVWTKEPTVAQEITYRECTIYFERKPYVNGHDWSWVHKDFDGAPDANDDRCGTEETMEACKEAIDEMFADWIVADPVEDEWRGM